MFRIDRRLVNLSAPEQVHNLQKPGEGTASPKGEQSLEAVRHQEDYIGLEAIAQAEERAKAKAEMKAEAEALLQKARQQAEEILQQARKDADELREEIQALHVDAKNQEEKAKQAKEEAEQQLAQIRQKQVQTDEECAEKLSQNQVQIMEQRRQIEVERQEIHRLAEKQGYQEGMMVVQEEGERQAAAHAESLRRLLDQIHGERARMVDEFEGETVRLCLSVARKIINTALENDEEAYGAMICHALNNMKREGKLTIRVSREEYRRFFASGTATFNLAEGEITAIVVDDPQLEKGDLMLESDLEILDAGADTQMRAITIAFERAAVAEEEDANG